jgi:hypothetical protein
MKPVVGSVCTGEKASHGSLATVTRASFSNAATASGKGGLAKVAHWIPQIAIIANITIEKICMIFFVENGRMFLFIKYAPKLSQNLIVWG